MADKTGMEMLQEILDQVKTLNHRLNVIEHNMKEILNRSNESYQKISKPAIQQPKITSEVPKQNNDKTAKVMGKLKTSDGKLVCGAKIKIINSNNEIIKETKTNRAGEILCFVPPGDYNAACFLQGIIDTKIPFKVGPEDKLVRF